MSCWTAKGVDDNIFLIKGKLKVQDPKWLWNEYYSLQNP